MKTWKKFALVILLILCVEFWHGWATVKKEKTPQRLGVTIDDPDDKCMWTRSTQCTTEI